MAIGTPVERYAQSRTTQGATTTFSPTGTIAAGGRAIIAATCGLAAGKVISSVTDDAGNTWAVDVTYNGPLSVLQASYASCQVTTQLTTSSVITINWVATTNNQVHIWLQEVTGLATSSAFDKSATGDGHLIVAGTAFTTAASSTLAQASEIVFVVTRGSDLTGVAVGAGYTQATTLSLGAPLSALEYKTVAATTAVTGSMSHSNTSDYVQLLATYKAAAAAANTPAPGFRFGFR